jgi:hypothetical protein
MKRPDMPNVRRMVAGLRRRLAGEEGLSLLVALVAISVGTRWWGRSWRS